MIDKRMMIAILMACAQGLVFSACVSDDAEDTGTVKPDASANHSDAQTPDPTPPTDTDAAPPEQDAGTDASKVTPCPATGCVSCADHLAHNPQMASGIYSIDPDGAGTAFTAMDAYCDSETDSGGWTLVVNYVHKDGTSPALVERATLPVIASSTLGTDESASATTWGHASLALMSALAPKELRFFGRTSAHDRVLSFKTNLATCITYATTGTGSCAGIEGAFTPFADHTAHLPAEANAWMSDKGAEALTMYPFYKTSALHWACRGGGARWEVDSYSDNTKPVGAFDTIHRVFVR